MLDEASNNALNELVKGGADPALQLVIWKARMKNPELAMVIKPEDIKGYYDCTEYLKVKPALRIFRPGGLPAIPPSAALGNRSATAGRPEIPFADYVVVQLVNDGTTDAFKPIENNQQDFDLQEKMNRIRAIRESIPELASIVKAGVARGQFSESEIADLCDAAITLARAPL